MNDNSMEIWIDEKYSDLSSDYLQLHNDEWCCEEEGMNLIESDEFLQYCEEQYELTL